MEERQGKELRIYGIGAYEPLINWLLLMLICSELILVKYLFKVKIYIEKLLCIQY